MSHPHEHDPNAAARSAQPRSAFAAPRLELPRFQFAPSAPPLGAPRPQPHAQQPAQPRHAWPTHAPVQHHAQPHPGLVPQHQPAPQQHVHHSFAPRAQVHHAPQAHVHHAPQQWQATATAHAPAPVHHVYAPPAPIAAPVRQPHRIPATTVAATSTARTTSIAWNPAAPEPERSWLQKVGPVHVGVVMVLVVFMMVMTSGPATMKAGPARLPAVVAGGGVSPDGVPMPTRAGATATNAAKAAGAPKAAAKAKGAAPRATKVRAGAKAGPRTLAVGSGRVRARVRAGGIPSPAAAANLAIAGGGRVAAGQTGSVRMDGIPSAAASEQLGPQKLAYLPTDGVTLPRLAGERDSHAIDTHYGATTLPMEEPIATPAMTPGGAAAQAERRVTIDQLSGGSTPPAHVEGGPSFAL